MTRLSARLCLSARRQANTAKGSAMVNEWSKTKVGDIVRLNTNTYSPKEKWPYVNYLDTGNITEGTVDTIQRITDCKSLPSRARRKVERGDIIFSTVRPNQKHYGLITDPLPNMVVSTGFAVLRGVEGRCDTRFLYYFLSQRHIIDYLHSIADNSTSAYPSIKPSDIGLLDIELPPIPVQRRIAHILGTLDDKIELNRRMNRTLEKMAAALFKSWFIDFDPVYAKAQSRDTGLPPDIAELFPDSFEDSDLGPIPKGWEVERLGDIFDLAYGKSLRAQDRRPGPVAVYGSNGQVGWHDTALVTGPGIVVGRKGNPGIVTWAPAEFYPIDTTFYVVPKGTVHSLYFLFYALQAHDLQSLGADSAVPGLNRNMAYMSKQIVSPENVLSAFDDFIKPIYDRIFLCCRQNQRLAGLRDTLLPKLLSGEIKLPVVEKMIEEVQRG